MNGFVKIYSFVKDRVVVNDRWGKGFWCKYELVCIGKDRYYFGKLKE